MERKKNYNILYALYTLYALYALVMANANNFAFGKKMYVLR